MNELYPTWNEKRGRNTDVCVNLKNKDLYALSQVIRFFLIVTHSTQS